MADKNVSISDKSRYTSYFENFESYAVNTNLTSHGWVHYPFSGGTGATLKVITGKYLEVKTTDSWAGGFVYEGVDLFGRDAEDWTDYKVIIDIKSMPSARFNILVRCSGTSDAAYTIQVLPGNTGNECVIDKGKKAYPDSSSRKAYVVPPATASQAVIECVGANIKVIIDGVKYLDWTDTESPILSGSIGVAALSAGWVGDNFKVIDLSGVSGSPETILLSHIKKVSDEYPSGEYQQLIETLDVGGIVYLQDQYPVGEYQQLIEDLSILNSFKVTDATSVTSDLLFILASLKVDDLNLTSSDLVDLFITFQILDSSDNVSEYLDILASLKIDDQNLTSSDLITRLESILILDTNISFLEVLNLLVSLKIVDVSIDVSEVLYLISVLTCADLGSILSEDLSIHNTLPVIHDMFIGDKGFDEHYDECTDVNGTYLRLHNPTGWGKMWTVSPTNSFWIQNNRILGSNLSTASFAYLPHFIDGPMIYSLDWYDLVEAKSSIMFRFSGVNNCYYISVLNNTLLLRKHPGSVLVQSAPYKFKPGKKHVVIYNSQNNVKVFIDDKLLINYAVPSGEYYTSRNTLALWFGNGGVEGEVAVWDNIHIYRLDGKVLNAGDILVTKIMKILDVNLTSVDSESILAMVHLAELGVGHDSFFVNFIAVYISDIFSGLDTLSVTDLYTIQDIGSGVDIVDILNSFTLLDTSGVTSDLIHILSYVYYFDQNSLVNEIIKIRMSKRINDIGVGVDDFYALFRLLSLSDSATSSLELVDILAMLQIDDVSGEVLDIVSNAMLVSITDESLFFRDRISQVSVLISLVDSIVDSAVEVLSLSQFITIKEYSYIARDLIKITNTFTLEEALTSEDDLSIFVYYFKIVDDLMSVSEDLSVSVGVILSDLISSSEEQSIFVNVVISDLDNNLTDILSILASFTIEDSTSGNDFVIAMFVKLVTDLAEGLDIYSVSAFISVLDTLESQDSVYLGDIINFVDQLGSAEVLSILCSLDISDLSYGLDLIFKTLLSLVSDSGAGIDVVDAKGVIRDLVDSGVGADVISILVRLSLLDSNDISFDIVTSLLVVDFIDIGNFTDILDNILVRMLLEDTGEALELLNIFNSFMVLDSGVSFELLDILNRFIVTDLGGMSDELLQIFVRLYQLDSGLAEDLFEKLAYVGVVYLDSYVKPFIYLESFIVREVNLSSFISKYLHLTSKIDNL